MSSGHGAAGQAWSLRRSEPPAAPGLRSVHTAHRTDRLGRGVPRCIGGPSVVRLELGDRRSHSYTRHGGPEAVLLGWDCPLQVAGQAGFESRQADRVRERDGCRARRCRRSSRTRAGVPSSSPGLRPLGRGAPDGRAPRPLRDRHCWRSRQGRPGAPRPARRPRGRSAAPRAGVGPGTTDQSSRADRSSPWATRRRSRSMCTIPSNSVSRSSAWPTP